MFSDKDLRKLIVPLVIEQILAVLVGTADTVMVSYAGESAISGVSLVDMFAYMVITILTALATGGAVIVSQYLGNKEQENANRAAGQLMVGTLLASGVVCVICAALNSQFCTFCTVRQKKASCRRRKPICSSRRFRSRSSVFTILRRHFFAP